MRFVLALVALGACAPEIRDDWFTCDIAARRGCPDGLTCVAGRCRTGGGHDAGRIDGGAFDAASADAARSDAETPFDGGADAGPECVDDGDCAGDRKCCDTRCVLSASDPANCGACDTDCDVCVMGMCDPTCTMPEDCDDDAACTIDGCDAAMCTSMLAPGNCFIGGVCFANGDRNPENPCETCDAAMRTDGWTARPDTTVCDSDGFPCTLESCRGGVCRTDSVACDPCEQCGATGCTPRAEGDPCVNPDLLCGLATCVGGTCVLTGECRGTGFRLDEFRNGGNCRESMPTTCERCGGSGLPCCISYPSFGPREACPSTFTCDTSAC
jgi:hypothetical protein